MVLSRDPRGSEMKTGVKWGNVMIWWEEDKHIRCTIIVQITDPWTTHNRLTEVVVGARMASYYPKGRWFKKKERPFWICIRCISFLQPLTLFHFHANHFTEPWISALYKNLILTLLIAYFQERQEFVTLAVILVLLAYTGHAAADSRHWQRFWWWTL